MNVVVHWVSIPELIGDGHYVPYKDIIGMFAESIRMFHPDARLVFLTDQNTPLSEGWENHIFPRKDNNIMGHMMLCRAQVPVEGPTVYADGDTLLNRPLNEIFEGNWKFAVPWDPFMCGVFLSKDWDYAREFFLKAYDGILDYPKIQQRFGADKPVTRELSEDAEKIPSSLICWTPPDSVHAYESPVIEGNPYIVNLKGGRKRYMHLILKEIQNAHQRRLQDPEPAAA